MILLWYLEVVYSGRRVAVPINIKVGFNTQHSKIVQGGQALANSNT
eukprot:COSAG02_NODE_18946_length_909_cov_1.029630_1_plen_45_part_01